MGTAQLPTVDQLEPSLRGGGSPGELWLRSPFMMRGYLSGGELSSPLDADGYFDTGDMAIVRDGKLKIVGRKKDLIIRGGENVSPKRIERVIDELDAVAESTVIGLPHPFWGEQIVACVVTRGDPDGAVADVGQHCREHLAAHERPDRVVVLEALPRSAIGKVLKAELTARVSEEENRS